MEVLGKAPVTGKVSKILVGERDVAKTSNCMRTGPIRER